jgi:hypothetical protein
MTSRGLALRLDRNADPSPAPPRWWLLDPVRVAGIWGSPDAPNRALFEGRYTCPASAVVHEALRWAECRLGPVLAVRFQCCLESAGDATELTAAAAAEVALKLGRFPELHHALFAAHGELSADLVLSLAAQAGIDWTPIVQT